MQTLKRQEQLHRITEKLCREHSLAVEEYEYLLTAYDAQTVKQLAKEAVRVRKRIYGNQVYIRGLIEISNICRNDCYYCGIRKSNSQCERYRLKEAQILECCKEGYALGFRTFVMQGGEDAYYSDDFLCHLLKKLKAAYPDCAVTLSLGERSKESYQRLYDAGADRYLLRHETANRAHYDKLHPNEMSHAHRMQCLRTLQEIGYQTGCGFMVGSPYQTKADLAADLKWIEEFQPDMCGIGPFLPHKDTPFANYPAGSVELTCFLLSILRLIRPNILLPATTALGSLEENGREKGILSGANVVMPNLSPTAVRKKYMLYDNKVSDGAESAQSKNTLEQRMKAIGYEIVTARGDIAKEIPKCTGAV